jgi:hypothetical protein
MVRPDKSLPGRRLYSYRPNVTITSFTAGAALCTVVDKVIRYWAYRLVPPTVAPDDSVWNAVQLLASGVGVVPVRTATTTLVPAGESVTHDAVCHATDALAS